MRKRRIALTIELVPIDPKSLPEDPKVLQQIVVDVTAQLDDAHGRLEKTQRLLQQLLAARSGTRSEQLSPDQLRLFAQEFGLAPEAEAEQESNKSKPTDDDPRPACGGEEQRPRGRQPLPRHLKRQRIVHDLADADKHCTGCQQALRHISEEVSVTNTFRRRCW